MIDNISQQAPGTPISRWLDQFDLGPNYDYQHPELSRRHQTFEIVIERARQLLQDYLHIYSKINWPDRHEWLKATYQNLCAPAVGRLSAIMKEQSCHTVLIGFDECIFLNGKKPVVLGADPELRQEMSLIAVRRVIKAADAYPTPSFKMWFTFIDTNPSVSGLVSLKGHLALSGRILSGGPRLLPSWSLMSFNQLAPTEPSATPGAAFEFDRLRMYGRPLWATLGQTYVLGLRAAKRN
ncbi:hypothetical protein NEOLEDRAFT_1140967 [Neolentinus lepideus HHB14362 ss-1]|uniref:Uncharacterized protein n=1 Tax=Neolentinus lepideus HHB14362 ss-1 TaxID=1314782 RepID=A0A165NY07_9AGAM|nr:hypothetical protein NEOLEDRAFT_1140967 [Neolentinus lepideus HHB14362 ss-1]